MGESVSITDRWDALTAIATTGNDILCVNYTPSVAYTPQTDHKQSHQYRRFPKNSATLIIRHPRYIALKFSKHVRFSDKNYSNFLAWQWVYKS